VLTRTRAERLDEAVGDVLAGAQPRVDAELRPLVDAATRLRAALPPLPAGERFEARLAARLLRPGTLVRLAVAIGRRVGAALRHPLRVTAVAAAVSAAALGAVATVLGRRRGGRFARLGRLAHRQGRG